MASRTRPADLLRHLDPGPAADAELLGRFAAARDQAAFAELVRRHGPLVLGVLRRVTGHPDDADDAFQAVFLTLARKAWAVRRPDLLANWLYGVAVRVGRRARRGAARRRRREVPAVNAPEPAATDVTPFEAGPELYEELDRLPTWYRDAVLLCDLQGLSRAEAAKRLGVPEGTLSSRLAGGRRRLSDRLARRGVALSAAGVPVVLGGGRGAAAVPDELITRTCGLVADWAAGGAAPAPVARLADGGFGMRQVMLAGVCGLVVASAGAMVVGRPADPPKPTDPAKPADKPVAKAEPKGDGKPVALTDRPRLRRAIDLNVPYANDLIWSPDGEWLALPGPDKPAPPPKDAGMGALGGGQGALGGGLGGLPPGPYGVTLVRSDGPRELKSFRQNFDPENDLAFVGFAPDGKQLVSARREYDLLSGRHELWFWGNLVAREAPFEGREGRIIDIDPDRTAGYTFPPGGESFRTLALGNGDGKACPVEVREVSLQTGRAVRTLLRFAVHDGTFSRADRTGYQFDRGLALTPDGRRLAVLRADDTFAVYDVPSGRELWTTKPDRSKPNDVGWAVPMGFGLSPDGRVLSAVWLSGRHVVLDAETGAAKPPPEGGVLQPGGHAGIRPTLSGDGRLVAADATRMVPDPATEGGTRSEGRFITVWDTATGKIVRSWPVPPDRPTLFRFHPRLPILAVAEQNGDKVRLGLWDFAAGGSGAK